MHRSHPALIAFYALFSFLAVRFAYAQYTSGHDTGYFISGYRGALVLLGFAIVCALFPKVGRWVAGSVLLLLGLLLLSIAIQTREPLRFTMLPVYFGIGIWLLAATPTRKKSTVAPTKETNAKRGLDQ